MNKHALFYCSDITREPLYQKHLNALNTGNPLQAIIWLQINGDKIRQNLKYKSNVK